jgi:RHS repeat-associated protein
VNANSSVGNNFRFAGQYFDQETGFHYNWHRYYDPRTGRYLTPDPSHTIQSIGVSAPYILPYLLKTPLELNPYQYVTGNPVNRTDPLGLFSCDGTWRHMGSARIAMWYCLCYWLCVPCDTPVIWSGDYKNLPSTTGQYIYQGGGGLESGDRCFCEKPGPEKDCDKCE